ncbi:MAG: alkaline phosphatase D family protein [Bacteroidota bacterium]
MSRFLLLALLLSTSGIASAQSDPNGILRSGPMLADVTQRGGTVWVQTDEGFSTVEVTAFAGGQPVVARAVEANEDGTASVVLFGLEPGTTYTYTVTVDSEVVETAYPLEMTTQELWQWRMDPPDITIAIGSCYYGNDPAYDRPDRWYAEELTYTRGYGGSTEIFETIRAMSPDAMIWLGDNVYLREVDWWSPEGIDYRYAHAREETNLQPLLASTVHYATWDDHDYGPNDSDRSYVHKEAALETFARFWPNPTYGMPGVPGVFTQFQIADAEFFLLDDRWYRAPNGTPPSDRVYWGEKQLQWLLDALTFSDAPFKVVANGGQMLNPVQVFENVSALAPHERTTLLEQIEARGIEGVVFLSGDRHHSELIQIDRAGTYPLLEYTSSPLTAGASTFATREDSPEYNNPARVDGTLVAGERNFGTLSFTGPRNDRTLTMRAYDAEGAMLWEHAVSQSDLRTPSDD